MQDIDSLDLLKLLESAHLGVVVHSWDSSVIYANPQALELLRLSYDQVIGAHSFDPQWSFIDEDFKPLAPEQYPVNRVIQTNKRIQNETIGVIDSTQLEVSWFMVNAYAERSDENNGFVVVTFNDITESRQGFSFEQIVEQTQDIVIVTEADDIEAPLGPKIIYVNKAFEDLTGYTLAEVKGETPRILQGDLTDKESCKRIHDALAENRNVAETLLNYSKSGKPYWLEMNIIPLRNRAGKVTHFAAIERDVTERKFYLDQLKKRNQDLKQFKESLQGIVESKTKELQQANEKLSRLAFYDVLTEIPNRRYFIDQTSKLIKFSERRSKEMAVGLIDIDDFKLVNDSYGHDKGDQVLKSLGSCLKDFFRQDDAYCRFGGEEFAFAVGITDKECIRQMCERLLGFIRELTFTIDNDVKINITASIGVTVYAPKQDTTLEDFTRHADIALYQAKEKGKNRVEFSD
ncbi:diguanylate cyclase [Aliikangiella sp. IMCC44653]